MPFVNSGGIIFFRMFGKWFWWLPHLLFLLLHLPKFLPDLLFLLLLFMQISEHFSIEELVDSQTATRQGYEEQFSPPYYIKDNLISLCGAVLEPLRALTGSAILISSGYRCERLNNAIGGAENSQHVKGQAADIKSATLTVEELYVKIKTSGIVFDQLIQEFGRWVHISYCSTTGENRGECLRAIKVAGETRYIPDNVDAKIA